MLEQEDLRMAKSPEYSGPTGWRCPVCGRGNAPHVAQCPCQCGGWYPVTFPQPYTPPWWPPFTTQPITTCQCQTKGTCHE